MKILIGYSMRSGSTLLQHILDQHSEIRSFSDLAALAILLRLLGPSKLKYHVCVKPMDIFYLTDKFSPYHKFDRFLWIARDPRDSYLSAIKSGYAYLLWPRGRKVHGIDIGLLKRWKRIYRHFFNNRDYWHLVRYEELASGPNAVLTEVFQYLGLPFEELLPFSKFKIISGGDYKLLRSTNVHSNSMFRYKSEMTNSQIEVFRSYLAREMQMLGYSPAANLDEESEIYEGRSFH